MKAVGRNRLSVAVRSALLCSLLPLAAVQAQEAQELDRIEVTGSRIKKAEVEGQTPVTTITREDIAQSGLTSVADIVQQLTGSGSSLNTKFNSSGNFGFPPDGSGVGAGSATVDLRHLGSKRVLVLVDGIRWVNEASASGVSASTDLNTIPVSFIERIEVLEDGASSIYGSDAIAGVVNIITRRSFDGVSASVYYGEFDEGGDTKSGELAFGGSGDNYSFFLGASTTEQDGISSTKYGPASVPIPGTGLTFGSSATPNGRFDFIDPVTGNRRNITTPNGQFFPNGPNFPGDFIPFGTPTRFNFAQFNLMLTPNERKGVFSQGRFDFSDSVSGYARVLYNQRESLNQAAPEPIFLGPGNGNFWMDNIVISASNPYSPFPFDLNADNINIVARRPVEGGARQFYQDVDTWYFGTGLEGTWEIGDNAYFWDVNYARSSNEADQTNLGSYNIRRIHTALGPLAGCQADPACVPLDIFSGPGAITPAMLAYIQPIIRDTSSNDLQLLSANLSGDLFNLPAGAVAFATGVEHRRLSGAYTPDGLTVAGEYNGVPSLPTSGEYDVDEYYAEFSVPIYAAGDSKLDLSLAARYSDYSTFGGETTGKAGFRWQFSDSFLLRGTYAQGFRAPSIGELFGSASRFDAQIDDPCLIGLDGSPPTAPAEVCRALGVPAGAEQANSQISVQTGGNPNLDPEEADSYTFGAVFSPAFASGTAWSERLDFEFTYYSHEIDGAVQAVDAQTQLNLCTATLNSPFCNGITRASNGFIGSFANGLQNFGAIETDGYDFDTFWTLPQTDWGTFKVSWQNTWVNDYKAVDGLGTAQPQGVGIEVNNSGIPEWTSNLGVDWAYGDFFAGWTLRHISDLTEQCGDAVDFDVCSNQAAGTNRLGSTTYQDLQLGWKAPWFEGTQFTFGVNNVFAKDPPISLSASLNGYDASTYDLPAGRFMYVRAEVKF
ncbi:MAG: TonB-dependent receptor [Chiayiivirga sp.]|jgi:iron complex outermembrane receptor protein|uniref:TonB-dependent receptor plug domain-containing protein n=1 Tax=Chiayiivirga sp. TaxID=2041042 RepID=UPI0025C44385|nr:TonB-dependent receptor [Chiayiivirga sp.]MCI1729605.1 TonB-dependent receptor [Chiayiivirga sp.]